MNPEISALTKASLVSLYFALFKLENGQSKVSAVFDEGINFLLYFE